MGPPETEAWEAGPAHVTSASLALRFWGSKEEGDAGPGQHPHPQRKEEAGLEPLLQPRVLGDGRGWKAWRRGLGAKRGSNPLMDSWIDKM